MSFEKMANRIAGFTSAKIVWSTPSEDYDGMSDTSSLELVGPTTVEVSCNDVSKTWELAGPPIRNALKDQKWPANPEDRHVVEDIVLDAYGVGLKA